MKLRVITLTLITLFASCNKLPFKQKESLQVVDTIVDFNTVDMHPTFSECDSIVEKEKQTDCFRATLHKKIGKELEKHKFSVNDSINETIFLHVKVDSSGLFSLEKLEYPIKIEKELPLLDSVLRASIKKLPKIFPATKRGIPVSSKYKMPIKIKL